MYFVGRLVSQPITAMTGDDALTGEIYLSGCTTFSHKGCTTENTVERLLAVVVAG